MTNTDLLQYTLQIADNALINGHRLSEWCGHGPVLEQDIAISNIALDHLGQARSLYQYAAEQFNKMAADVKQDYFSSPSLQQKIASGAMVDEDDLAYLRDGWDFRNVLLVEQPNKDWGYTVARSFFLDVFNYYFFSALKESKDETLAAIADKSLKEVTYHLRWSSEWMIRLGDGTEESHRRIREGVEERWAFTGEMLTAGDVDEAMRAEGIAPDLAKIRDLWNERVRSVFEEAGLDVPAGTWMQEGGKTGIHTEHLGYILTELQFMQRAYPNMSW